MKRGVPLALLAESFVAGLVDFGRRVGHDQRRRDREIKDFVDATDLNELQRIRATTLLELAFDLELAGRHYDASRAAGTAFPVDATARLVVHVPAAISYERVTPRKRSKRRSRSKP